MTDLQEGAEDSSDLWDKRPDWIMLGTGAALLVGWVVWIGVIAYRLVAS